MAVSEGCCEQKGMDIFMIDAIGPFFRGYRKQRINWSKIPFDCLSADPQDSCRQFEMIGRDLDLFCRRVAKIGYNSISLDDVAHLTPHPWLEPRINETIAVLQDGFRHLFAIGARHGLAIYLTMDVLSLTAALRQRINGCSRRAILYVAEQVDTVLTSFPEISGIILRIGECDGKDVRGDFRSELILRTAGQVNRMLHGLLPVFERHRRLLILRNWTVGAYRVGDLIWHRGTTARVLRGIDSQWFILSMKYGESDFFRYLPLSEHFFRFPVKKIVELQARREYEGSGEFPSFIGWDYQEYARQLENAQNLVGISVWCQTGGWLPFRRLSFLEESAVWNELNAFVTVKIFRERLSVEEAVALFADRIGCNDKEGFLELVRLDDQVIKELLYIEELADRTLFFRRVRIPPLLTVFWNTVFVNHSLRKILRSLVDSGEQSVETGWLALAKIKRMQELAGSLGLPVDDLQFMADTFFLLALAREYYFLPYDDTVQQRIREAKKQYKKRYPKQVRPRYRIKANFAPFALRSRHLRWLFWITLRNRRGYRLVDYLLTLHLLSLVYRLIVRSRPKVVPKFARKRAMGIDAVFR
jgi:hypothetical protein